MSISVPKNDLLRDELILSRSMFDKIQNLNQITITSNFGIKRNRNAFLTGNDILDFFSETQEKHGPSLKRFYVKAKDEGEQSKNIIY